jgi:PAS domain S-box-containing protein
MKIPRVPMPLASRFSLAFGILILCIFLVVGLVTGRHLSKSTREQAELRLAGYSRSLSSLCLPALMNYDYITLQQIADDAVHEPNVTRVMILDKEGLIAGLSAQRERVGERVQDPVSLRGLISVDPFEVQEKDADGYNILDRVEPVSGPFGARWGTVRVALSLRSVEASARDTTWIVVLMALTGTLLAFGLSHILVRRIIKPLGLLVDKTVGLARGEWNPEPKICTGDEIEILAEQFTLAAESLDRQKRELTRARDELAGLNETLEQKVLERTAELAESQEKYRLLVEASPDPLSLMQKGRFRFVNRAFLETFGYTEEQVQQPTFTVERLLHPDFVRVVTEVLGQAESTGEPVDSDCVAIGRGGRSLEFDLRGRRVTYENAPAIELLWIDQTVKKRLMRQMVQNERLRGVGEMTTMVAHNFNNLLAVILGRTQLLQARSDDPSIRKGLEIVRTAALQGGEIVKRIQEYSGEETDLQFREVNLAALIREVAGYLENVWRVTRLANVGPVQIEVVAEEVPPVLGSEHLLGEVLKHVLMNAAEAMPGGGVIRVELGMAEDLVRVGVADSGCGMTPEVRRRAFDPFFTTKGLRTRGLGLSVSYGIVQRHRGRLELRPREEGGTLVEVLLPVHQTLSRESHPAADSPVVFMSAEQATARRILQSLRSRAVAADAADGGEGGADQERIA